MTFYRISPTTSVYTSVYGDHAFDSDSTGPDSLTLDTDAFLVAAGGFRASGAHLANTGAWTVSVNGSVVSSYDAGLTLDTGNTGVSMITVGAEGSVRGGDFGMLVGSSAIIQNAGTISGSTFAGIYLVGTGAHTITNTGILEGAYGILDQGGPNNDTVTNSGTIMGSVALGDGHDTFTNVRTVGGVTTSGNVHGTIDLGDGNDKLTGGVSAETVQDNDGSDTVVLGDGDDTWIGVGATTGPGGGDGLDVINGGTGLDTYDANGSTAGIEINLDGVAHDLAPFAPGAFRVAARTVDGDHVAGAGADTVISIENVKGGSGADIVYGSTAGNVIEGNGGSDFLFGYGGNDRLNGGASSDNLVGGTGRDVLVGGAQADFFHFTSSTDSGTTAGARDLVTDFEDGWDVIALDRIDAKADTAPNDAFTFIGTDVDFRGRAGELRAIHTATGLRVQGDVNGDGRADIAIDIADASYAITLTGSDFSL